MADLLRQVHWSFDQLDAVGVTIGPGAFTGIRIGIAAARGLALTLGIPAIGATTLSVMAAAVMASDSADKTRCASGEKEIIVALDTKRRDWYWQLFKMGTLDAEPAQARLSERSEPLIADGTALIKEAMKRDTTIFCDRPDLWDTETSCVHPAVVQPDARWVPTALRQRDENLHRVPPFCPPEPLYLRPAEARPAQAR